MKLDEDELDGHDGEGRATWIWNRMTLMMAMAMLEMSTPMVTIMTMVMWIVDSASFSLSDDNDDGDVDSASFSLSGFQISGRPSFVGGEFRKSMIFYDDCLFLSSSFRYNHNSSKSI